MKKNSRVLAMLLVVMFAFSAMMPIYAHYAGIPELRATTRVTCGFTKKTGNNYQFWGKLFYYESANLSINVYLYSNSGSFMSSCSNAEIGTSVSARKTVSLSSGTYIVKAYGYVSGVLVAQNETSITIP